MKLVDTTVALDHLRGELRATALLGELLASDETIVASELTRLELLAGMRPDERDASERFFSVLSWVPVTEHIARVAGDLANARRTSRANLGPVDYLIGATALVLEAELLTTATRRYPMLPGIRAAYSAR